jgi:site-specific DNA-adenine methylase
MQLIIKSHTLAKTIVSTMLNRKPYKTVFGGKEASGSYQQIINQIRPHDIYLELFLFNGTVYRYKKPATLNYLNDKNPRVIEDWKNNSSVDNVIYTISDAIEFLKTFTFETHLRYCIYLDPPYPHSSRKSKHRYKFEMSDDEHRALISVIKQLPENVDVLISTYKNKIYEDGLKDWRLHTYESQTRKGLATEYLYMNYSNESGLLHDYSYLGEDRTDRQRIKRKIEREVNKLLSLPAQERNAIIEAVKNLHRL